MKLQNSKYHNEKFLGKQLYKRIREYDEIFTIQEFFSINDAQKEYFKDGADINDDYYSYKLMVCEGYYELNCERNDDYLSLIFDKPVHITGEYCIGIIAPEIIIKSSVNKELSYCVSNKLIINNGYDFDYYISFSKINNVYFYNKKFFLNKSEINNLFVFHPNLQFSIVSIFLIYQKIKCFGKCDDLKEKISNYKLFKDSIIHIE